MVKSIPDTSNDGWKILHRGIESLLVQVRFPQLNFCTFWTNRIWQITGKRLKDPTSHEWVIQGSFTTWCPKLVFTSAEIYSCDGKQELGWIQTSWVLENLESRHTTRHNSIPLVPWNKSDGRRKVPVSYKTNHQIKYSSAKCQKTKPQNAAWKQHFSQTTQWKHLEITHYSSTTF